MDFKIPISRRDFMKLAGITAGAVIGGNFEDKKVSAATVEQNFNFDGKNIPVLLSADVCVCGGGSAGTAAAVTAARNGLKVVLIESGTVLGGLQTQGLVYPAMPTRINNSDTPYITDLNKRFAVHGFDVNFSEAPADKNGGTAREYQPELLAFIYDEMCADYNVDVLYNTTLIGAKTSAGKISEVIIHTVEGLRAISAKIFVDATGDAVLSRYVGVPVEKGSEHTGRNQKMSLRESL